MVKHTAHNEGYPTLADTLRDLSWTIHRRLPDAVTTGPLPTTELATLKHIIDTPGVTVSQLSRYLGMQQSNTSASVRTLVDKGYVERRHDTPDRRVTNLHPTAYALDQHLTIAAAWSGAIDHGIDKLTPQQQQALADARQAFIDLDAALRDR